MSQPRAVLISDIHYNLKNLELADAALTHAIETAKVLKVPLYILGDLHDSKANHRGECISRIISTFEYAELCKVPTAIIVGNHSLINEKSGEHALHFLGRYTNVISHALEYCGFFFVPYQHDPERFENIVSLIPKGSTILCHQGITGAASGEYIYDKSAVNKEILADYRTISGHYHQRQDIKCGRPRKGAVGLASYLGSPYTITFAEADDGPKGFSVLMDDGTLEFVPTNLRKHVIIEWDINYASDVIESGFVCSPAVGIYDAIWVKVKGPSLLLHKLIDRESLAKCFGVPSIKLDLIPTDSERPKAVETEKLSNSDLFDHMIDTSSESDDHKAALKKLWREIV